MLDNNMKNPEEPDKKFYFMGGHKDLVFVYREGDGKGKGKLESHFYDPEKLAGWLDLSSQYAVLRPGLVSLKKNNKGRGDDNKTNTPRNPERKYGDIPLRSVRRFMGQLPRLGDEIPVLDAIVYAPGISQDGDLIYKRGYYPEQRVLYDDMGTPLPKLPETITRDMALRALEDLRVITKEFPWDEEYPSGETVALASFMTPMIRPYIPIAPVFLFTADRPNTGKSLLADISSIIGVNETAYFLNLPKGKYAEEHIEKRIVAMADNQARVICIDNVGENPASDALCSYLTQESVKGHVLYLRADAKYKNIATYIITGNNVAFSDDLAERALVSVLKNPGKKRISFKIKDLKAFVRENRPVIHYDVITVIKYYQDSLKRALLRHNLSLNSLSPASGLKSHTHCPSPSPSPSLISSLAKASSPSLLSILSSSKYLSKDEKEALEIIEELPESDRFGPWAKLVRNPLIWLGMPDPLLNNKYIEKNDLFGQAMDDLKEAWYELFEEKSLPLRDALLHPGSQGLNQVNEKRLRDHKIFLEACEYALLSDGKRPSLMTGGGFPTNVAQFIQKHNDDGLSDYVFVKTPWRGRHKYSLTLRNKS
jgi:hypothetical protein